jgi:hypothetical protein
MRGGGARRSSKVSARISKTLLPTLFGGETHIVSCRAVFECLGEACLSLDRALSGGWRAGERRQRTRAAADVKKAAPLPGKAAGRADRCSSPPDDDRLRAETADLEGLSAADPPPTSRKAWQQADQAVSLKAAAASAASGRGVTRGLYDSPTLSATSASDLSARCQGQSRSRTTNSGAADGADGRPSSRPGGRPGERGPGRGFDHRLLANRASSTIRWRGQNQHQGTAMSDSGLRRRPASVRARDAEVERAKVEVIVCVDVPSARRVVKGRARCPTHFRPVPLRSSTHLDRPNADCNGTLPSPCTLQRQRWHQRPAHLDAEAKMMRMGGRSIAGGSRTGRIRRLV